MHWHYQADEKEENGHPDVPNKLEAAVLVEHAVFALLRLFEGVDEVHDLILIGLFLPLRADVALPDLDSYFGFFI